MKSMLSSTGFELIIFEKRFEDANPVIVTNFTMDDYYRQCAYSLRCATSYGQHIMDYLPELDYFCLTEEEFVENNNNPFLWGYLMPMLNDVADDLELIMWQGGEWV